MSRDSIFVTRPHLPALDRLIPHLEKIWASRVLTNSGPYHNLLEKELQRSLNVQGLSLYNNATIALISAIKALELKGEIITTPYSFVATASSIIWAGCEPVFVDIEQEGFNIDPNRIEEAIGPNTVGILPVHCYGYPCDYEAIKRIADRYGLKVIYDAAHAFGVECDCGSVLEHGDVSVLSFHSTKAFNTLEGGATITKDSELKSRLEKFRNFGFEDETTVSEVGINGKLNEVSCALGLLQIEDWEAIRLNRSSVDQYYRDNLLGTAGLQVPIPRSKKHNFSYFPILVDSSYRSTRDELYELMKKNGIYARRYFYPLITEFSPFLTSKVMGEGNLAVARSVADRILCLPIYPGLTRSNQDRVIELIQKAFF